MKCFFYIRNSKITNPKVIKNLFDPEGIGSVSLKDGRWSMELQKEGKRSLAQNAYFHAILPLILQGLKDAGFSDIKDTEDAKNVCKGLFLKEKIVNQETGEVITEIIKDTSKLTTIEFMEFMDDVVMWAASYLGVTIPAPNSQSEFDYAENF